MFRVETELFLRQRADHHDHLTAFHLGHVLDLAKVLDVFGHTFQQFTPKILVRHLTATEAQRDFDLVAVFQET